jgi:hypothetical protein
VPRRSGGIEIAIELILPTLSEHPKIGQDDVAAHRKCDADAGVELRSHADICISNGLEL